MRLLIDTHIFIWSVTNSEKLSGFVRKTILDAAETLVSAASIWEIAIKSKLGKLKGNPFEFVGAIEDSGFKELAISAKHAARVYSLPLYHRDPFDRLLLAQAISEHLHFLTTDTKLPKYTDLVILA